MRLTLAGMKKLRDAVWARCVGDDRLKSTETDEVITITKNMMVPKGLPYVNIVIPMPMAVKMTDIDKMPDTRSEHTKVCLTRGEDFLW